MINIYLGDKTYQLEPTHTLSELLAESGHVAGHFAVAINHKVVPRVAYDKTRLLEGDRVDIIVPMQGG